MENLEYYLAILLVIVVAVWLLKKVTSCLMKIVIGIIALALIAWALSSTGLVDLSSFGF